MLTQYGILGEALLEAYVSENSFFFKAQLGFGKDATEEQKEMFA